MLAPVVVSLSETLCVLVYVPGAGEKVGVAVCEVTPEAVYVHEMTSAITVAPPVPPVKPRKPVLEPRAPGMLTVQLVVKVAAVTASVMVIVSVVPS